MKDPWIKPKGGSMEGGRWGRQGKVVAEKWKQLYSNNNGKNTWTERYRVTVL